MSLTEDTRVVRNTLKKLKEGLTLEQLQRAFEGRMDPERVRECVAILIMNDSIFYNSKRVLLARNQ